jgi:hypothetical protein
LGYQISRIEPNILYIVLEGDLIPLHEEIDHVVSQQLQEMPTPTHFIVDLQGVTRMQTLPQLTAGKTLRAPNLGWTLLVGHLNRYIQTVTDTAAHMFRVRVRHVATVEDALCFLDRVEEGLRR